ncbi:hypothetical protein CRUP_024011, partial [Coryphaenoides rupestris]
MSRLSAAQSYAPAAGEMEGREAGEGGDTDKVQSRCNNIVLETDEKYSLNEDGSELTIKNITKVDEGDYACIARNKAGDKDEEVGLKVF